MYIWHLAKYSGEVFDPDHLSQTKKLFLPRMNNQNGKSLTHPHPPSLLVAGGRFAEVASIRHV